MKPAYKTVGLAAGLGLASWLAAPNLLPVKLPADFPALPDLQGRNQSLRSAVQNADKEARKKPGSAEIVGKLGLTYHANEFPDQAGVAYRIAARLAPGEAQWIYARAVLQEENGNVAEQLKALQETLRLKPDHVPALMKMADSYFKQDKMDRAAHYYELAAKAPGSAAFLQATFGLGRVAARRKEWDKVVETIMPLRAKFSHVMPPYEPLLEAYTALGQAVKAAETKQHMALATWKVMPPVDDALADQLTNLSFSSTRLLKQAGLFGRVGRPDRAIEVARRAVQAEPSDPEARYFLARALLTFFGDRPEAVEEGLTQLSECLRLRPGDLLPLWGFANDFFKSQKTTASIQRLRGLLRPHADAPEAHYPLGLVADALGETEEAVTQYLAALKHDPKDSAACNKLGVIFEKARKLDEAIGYFQKAVQVNAQNAIARRNLGLALLERGNMAQGVKELGELLKLNPYDVTTHFSLGFALLDMRRPSEAAAHFREGLRYESNDAEAHFGLGSALSMLHKREEAISELREALRLRPGLPPAQELLSQLVR